MRKRIAVACCCGVFFVVAWAFGQQALDASRWSEYGKRDELARTMYVKGYLDGYADGDSAMEKITVVLTTDDPPDALKKKLVAPQALRLPQMIGLGKNRDVTVGKIKDAMSSFYGDYRNAPVCWNAALQFSVWSLNGEAPTEQELDSARKRGAGNGCN
jgi:hypothetical protein